MTQITFSEDTMRRIVRAIEKAINTDVPIFAKEHPLDSDNYLRMIKSDFINTNLRDLLQGENIDIIRFKRYSWKGRIIVDHTNKATYSITTKRNLDSIPGRVRSKPHFLQSLIGIENAEYKGQYKQMCLFPEEELFDHDTLEADYENIVDGVLRPDSGYTHYVIAYEYNDDELTNVQLLLLAQDFSVIKAESLNEFIKPDYSKLTEPDETTHSESTSNLGHDLPMVGWKNQESLVKLKQDIGAQAN